MNSLYKPFRNLAILFVCLVSVQTAIAQGIGIRQINLMINPKPTVKFGAGLNSSIPMTFDFSDSSSVSPGTITGWSWDFGDGSTSSLKNPRHTYSASGYYDVQLTVETQAGCESSVRRTILMENPDGMGIAVNNPIQCSSGNSFAYTGTGVAGGVTYLWDFGDGTTSAVQAPTHSYADSGTYMVRLITTAIAPGTLTDTAYLTVKSIPTPNVDGINHVYCSGEVVPAHYFTGGFAGTTYKWNRILGQDMGMGLTETSGVDSIPSFIARNTGISYLAPVYRVTPYYTSDGITCAGPTENFLITVNPVPTMADVIDNTYANGTAVGVYTFTGNTPNAEYNWSYLSGDTLAGLPTRGISQIPAFTAKNEGATLLTAQYRAIPSYSYANKTCFGIADTFSISITPDALVTMASRVPVCSTESEAVFSCVNNNPVLPIYYRITFSDKALEAGFSNMGDYALLSGNSVHVALPTGLESGQYTGHLFYVQDRNYQGTDHVCDFVIDVTKRTAITKQLQADMVLCDGNGFIHLKAEAEGSNLTYQWYKDDATITGAIYSIYEKRNATSSDFGSYNVEVNGDCGSEKSQAIKVRPSNIVIMAKWDDVLFVSRRDSSGNKLEIISFQWYRVTDNGDVLPISEKGQSQYYSEKGLKGTFMVEVTLSNGTKYTTCPYTLVPVKNGGSIKIYPNPGKTNEKINVSLDLAGSKIDGAVIEVFDEAGKLMAKKAATGSITEFYLDVAAGMYVFCVIEPNGNITTQKVILN